MNELRMIAFWKYFVILTTILDLKNFEVQFLNFEGLNFEYEKSVKF